MTSNYKLIIFIVLISISTIQIQATVSSFDSASINKALSLIQTKQKNPKINVIGLNEQVPNGWQIMTFSQAKQYQNELKPFLDKEGSWSVIALEQGKVEGAGNGYKIHESQDPDCCQKKFTIEVTNQQNSQMNGKNVLNEISLATDYAVDDALKLLQLLLSESEQELTDRTNQYLKNKKDQEDVIQGLKNDVAQQIAKCDALDTVYNQKQSDLAGAKQQKADNENQIKKNQDQIAANDQLTCDKTKLYVTNLKEGKDSLDLYDFLKNAVQNFQKNPNLAELAKFTEVLSQIRSYSKYDKATLNKNVRTTDEIGSGHIDTLSNQLKVENFSPQAVEALQNVKGQLLKLIEDLANNTQSYLDNLIVQQNQFNDQIATKKQLLESENRRLTDENKQLDAKIQKLEDEIKDLEKQRSACRAEQLRLETEQKKQEQQLQQLINKYNSDKQAYDEQIRLFNYIIQLYKTQLQSINETLKQRTQDYIDDQKFDNTTPSRETQQYESLTGNVDQTITQEANQRINQT